jgi:hypothetical protein
VIDRNHATAIFSGIETKDVALQPHTEEHQNEFGGTKTKDFLSCYNNIVKAP